MNLKVILGENIEEKSKISLSPWSFCIFWIRCAKRHLEGGAPLLRFYTLSSLAPFQTPASWNPTTFGQTPGDIIVILPLLDAGNGGTQVLLTRMMMAEWRSPLYPDQK